MEWNIGKGRPNLSFVGWCLAFCSYRTEKAVAVLKEVEGREVQNNYRLEHWISMRLVACRLWEKWLYKQLNLGKGGKWRECKGGEER